MNIKTDILKAYIADMISSSIQDFGIDANEIVDSTAIKALSEIQQVLHSNELDDFQMVEEIVLIFEKYNLDAGVCHDF